MTETQNSKQYDLEECTLAFAKRVRSFVRTLPKSVAYMEDARQVVRSSGSVGANYIEANESLSKKDFSIRVKICRKEAKETRYWLQLLEVAQDPAVEKERLALLQEAIELMLIFGFVRISIFGFRILADDDHCTKHSCEDTSEIGSVNHIEISSRYHRRYGQRREDFDQDRDRRGPRGTRRRLSV